MPTYKRNERRRLAVLIIRDDVHVKKSFALRSRVLGMLEHNRRTTMHRSVLSPNARRL